MRPLWQGMFGGLDAPVQPEGQSNMEEGRRWVWGDQLGRMRPQECLCTPCVLLSPRSQSENIPFRDLNFRNRRVDALVGMAGHL